MAAATNTKSRVDSSFWTVAIAIFIAVIALTAVPKWLDSNAMIGKDVPSLVLPKLGTDEKITLASLKGKVVVLDFWAPWCGPCRQEMPILDSLAKRFADKNVVVLGVLVDDDRVGATAFLKSKNIGYPQIDDVRREAATFFKVRTLPSLVVLDKQGKVSSYQVGLTGESDLEDAIKKAM